MIKNNAKIIEHTKCYFPAKKKSPAGLHHTKDRAGDAPKPTFSIKFIENNKQNEITTETAEKKTNIYYNPAFKNLDF